MWGHFYDSHGFKINYTVYLKKVYFWYQYILPNVFFDFVSSINKFNGVLWHLNFIVKDAA